MPHIFHMPRRCNSRSLLASETLEDNPGVLVDTEVLSSRSVCRSSRGVVLLTGSGLQSRSGTTGESLHLVEDN
jgi:hypothetical protein